MNEKEEIIIPELFILGPDRLVDLNRTWISTIKEFKVLLTRDKTSGKKQAQKEFTFIYHFIDFRSQFDSYSESDKFKISLKNAGLPEDLKVDKDKDLKEAMNLYEEIKISRKLRVVRGALKAVDTVTAYYNIATVGDADAAKAIMASVNTVGKTIANLDELEKQVKKELSENTGLRGENKKGHREDPK